MAQDPEEVRGWRSPRGWMALGLSLVVVAGIGVTGGRWWWQEVWQQRCGVTAQVIDPETMKPVFTPIGQLPVADRPDALVRALSALDGPYGEARTGLTEHDGAPALISSPDSAVLAYGRGLPGVDFDGSIVNVSLPDGNPRWGRGFSGAAPGGGVLGGRFISAGIPEDRAPEIARYAMSDGSRDWCTELGEDVETEWSPSSGLSDIGGDPVVMWPDPADGVSPGQLTRLYAGTGKVRWQVPVVSRSARRIMSTRDVVITGSLAKDQATAERALYEAVNHDIDPELSPYVAAYAADTGKVLWKRTTPAKAKGASVSKLAGIDRERNLVLLEKATTERTGRGLEPEDVTRSVEAVDARTGEVLWGIAAPGSKSVRVIDGHILIEHEPAGRSTLTAYDLADGSGNWEIAGAGKNFHWQLDSAVDIDGHLLTTAGGHLWSIDLATGRRSKAPYDGPRVRAVAATADFVIVRTNDSVVVLDHR